MGVREVVVVVVVVEESMKYVCAWKSVFLVGSDDRALVVNGRIN